jgi:hypothetical protein
MPLKKIISVTLCVLIFACVSRSQITVSYPQSSQPPQNDNCEDATPLDIGTPITGTTTGATPDFSSLMSEQCIIPYKSGLVWYTVKGELYHPSFILLFIKEMEEISVLQLVAQTQTLTQMCGSLRVDYAEEKQGPFHIVLQPMMILVHFVQAIHINLQLNGALPLVRLTTLQWDHMITVTLNWWYLIKVLAKVWGSTYKTVVNHM